jgi:hypothetical protein
MERGRCCSALIAFFLVAIATDPAHAEIHFDDFASVEGLSLVGDASVSGKVVRLTPARRNQAGAVCYRNKQPVRSGFDTVDSGCFGDQAGVRLEERWGLEAGVFGRRGCALRRG